MRQTSATISIDFVTHLTYLRQFDLSLDKLGRGRDHNRDACLQASSLGLEGGGSPSTF